MVGSPAAARELRLREGQIVAAVDAHDFAGGPHLRAENGIDLGKALEREHRFLDADMLGRVGRVRSKLQASRRP